jgi:nucleoside-diphosphate-sugar epimerase
VAAANDGVKRFIFISSIKVNGEGRADAYTEDDEVSPQDHYGVSKWEAEQELRKISDTTDIEMVILRPPLVYGPGVKANFLRLFKIVERGFPLPLSSIKNRRSFIYLGNLIDAIITCINHPEAAGHTFLVGDEENISTPGLIRQIALALKKPARLFSIPPFLMQLAGKFIGKSAAIDRLLGSLTIDSTKIRKKLEWKPPYTIEQGIKETAMWYQKAD